MTARDRALEWGYAAAWRLVRMLPERAAQAAFRTGADRAVRRRGLGMQRLAGNLRQVVGPDMSAADFDVLVRDAMRSYARYWCDAFRLPSRSPEQHRAGFRLGGGEILVERCRAGLGTVLALPHGGNWDAAGAWVASMGMPITTVAERLKPESVYRRFLAFREGLGMEILPLTGGGRPVLDELAERVRAGTVVPLLADRDFSARGVEVTFFGQRTKMPPGPAILALRTGAPLYVVDMWYEPDRPVGQMSAPLVLPGPEAGPLDDRVRQVTQMVADHFAAGIAAHPTDWHMLAKMFLGPRLTDPVEPASRDARASGH
jgi:phosphatidylinositol dimannoside acyltransferase